MTKIQTHKERERERERERVKYNTYNVLGWGCINETI